MAAKKEYLKGKRKALAAVVRTESSKAASSVDSSVKRVVGEWVPRPVVYWDWWKAP